MALEGASGRPFSSMVMSRANPASRASPTHTSATRCASAGRRRASASAIANSSHAIPQVTVPGTGPWRRAATAIAQSSGFTARWAAIGCNRPRRPFDDRFSRGFRCECGGERGRFAGEMPPELQLRFATFPRRFRTNAARVLQELPAGNQVSATPVPNRSPRNPASAPAGCPR